MNADLSDRNSCVPRDVAWVLALSFGALPLLPLFILAERAKQGDPTLLWLGLASALVGTSLLFRAKRPLWQQRIFFSFGSKQLPPSHRRLYRVAYAGIICSSLCMGALIAALG